MVEMFDHIFDTYIFIDKKTGTVLKVCGYEKNIVLDVLLLSVIAGRPKQSLTVYIGL